MPLCIKYYRLIFPPLQPTPYPWLSLHRQVPSSHPLRKHVIKSLKGPFISFSFSFFFLSLRSAVEMRLMCHHHRWDCRGLHKGTHWRQSLGSLHDVQFGDVEFTIDSY